MNVNSSPRTTTYVNPNQLTATVAAADIVNVGSRSVSVINPEPGGGGSNALALAVTAPANNPVPALSTLAPAFTTAGSPGFTLTINGTGFVPGATVKWNSTVKSPTFLNSNQLQVSVTAGEGASQGTVTITVTNPSPGGGESNGLLFAINPSAICNGATADIIALDKVGEIVTITGSGNLTGWYIISLAGNQRFDFPNGFVAGGLVQIKSGVAQFANTQSMLWWTSASQWNNATNDDAVLFNCLDQQVDFFDDGF